MLKNLLIAVAIVLVHLLSRIPQAAADVPERGDFGSFGVLWKPPANSNYNWPVYKSYIAAYEFRGGSDRSTANIRVLMAPAQQLTVAEIADDLVQQSQAQILDKTLHIDGERAIKLTAPVSVAGFHRQTSYIVVHDNRKYTFAAFDSGADDQAATAARDALDQLVPTVRFSKPDDPAGLLGEKLLPPMRFEGDLQIGLSSMMRDVDVGHKGAHFMIHNYTADADAMLVAIEAVGSLTVKQDDPAFIERFSGSLKKSLNCVEQPTLTRAAFEPRFMLTQPLHSTGKDDGSRQCVRVGLAFFQDGRVVQIMFWIPNRGPQNEDAYLQLVGTMVDSIRIQHPTSSHADALPLAR